MPDPRGPASPTALAALCSWLDQFDDRTSALGRSYFKEGRVLNPSMDGSMVYAPVVGTRTYDTCLLWGDDNWTSECTCPLGVHCKHAVAVGLAWVRKFDRSSAGLPPKGSPRTAIKGVITGSDLLAAASKRKVSFREQWSPVIAEKLGRPLTNDEAHRLGQLSALHQASSLNFYGGIPAHLLIQHGFPVSAAAHESDINYYYAFRDWWPVGQPPADPWALWQYIAYDWERSGREIPEVFRPMTDTTQVRALVEDRLVQRELTQWRQALLPPPPAASPASLELAKAVDVRLLLGPDGKFLLQIRAAVDADWKFPTHKWVTTLSGAGPADFAHLPPAAAALATALASENDRYSHVLTSKEPLTEHLVRRALAHPPTHPAIILPDGSSWRVEPESLRLQASVNPTLPQRLDLSLTGPEGRTTGTPPVLLFREPAPHYLFNGRIHRGPPPPPLNQLPVQALADPAILSRLRAIHLELPAELELRFLRVPFRPFLRCSLSKGSAWGGPQVFHASLFAMSDEPRCAQHWSGRGGWQWTKDGAPPPRRPEDPILELDLTAANAIGARFADFKLYWSDYEEAWCRNVTRNFPEEFLNWRASLPPDLVVEAQGELAGLAGPALRATLDFSALPAAGEAGRDWFDLTVALRIEDTTLDAEEIALLLKARGKWVQLPRLGWRRLEISDSAETRATLDRLGLDAGELDATGKPVAFRLHALQLAGEAAALESRDARLAAALRERTAALATIAPPALPAGLRGELRPYQREGFHYLAHLSANGLGGILADDMGLGKTVQTLAWLLHLADATDRPVIPSVAVAAMPAVVSGKKSGRQKKPVPAVAAVPPPAPAIPALSPGGVCPFRALVVCPKSVVHGWLTEGERFTPSLAVRIFTPAMVKDAQPPGRADGPALLVANYAQLRINAAWFQQHAWDAVILDEAQFIKNPTSQTAAVARTLATRHRLALTGTPIENRLLDLWSLLAYAQPGLLGTQTAFKRQHRDDDPTAPARLQRRVLHFLLRRTKAQVATDLPPRTEDEIVVELEGGQRKLYDAELKRARSMLLGLDTDRALDAMRFNILASLLRLRQICCHPALIDPAHHDLPSAKLDALMERLEELRDEGHQVLVFSQFVQLLEIIQARLEPAGIKHLLLTGQTENRPALVEKFQADRSQTVFLLSLRAAGFGLNLTAASYVILCDPWWNPAVEAQAIDRTHRIGQTRPVIAYRLLADNTIEQKIRALQKEKAALAASVVQEESLASVLDLDSLRQILG